MAVRGVAVAAISRLLQNVGEAVSARQKLAKKRSLQVVNEHFEPIFNAAMATQVVFQQSASRCAFWLLLCLAGTTYGAVLPEDRADLLYHSYDGGGVTIQGPSVLVRKAFADTVSVSANYYVDKVTGASIDVEASASAYVEERIETSVGVDYLYDSTLMSLSYSTSNENDYQAKTIGFSVSQDFFGDLTTLSLGYSLGDDTIGRNDEADFAESLQRRRYSLSLTQVLTKSWIVALNAESVVDEGYLNNPYRSVRYLDNGDYFYQREQYPGTRNSDALALRSMVYLPYRAAVKTELRGFTDSWGIEAHNLLLSYTHPFRERWLFEGKVRYYQQTQADFYADLYPFIDAQNFLARDKELSTFNSTSYGLGFSYQFESAWLSAFDSRKISLFWDHIIFDYDNFRNLLVNDADPGEEPRYDPGEEPLYGFNANVLRLFVSFTY